MSSAATKATVVDAPPRRAHSSIAPALQDKIGEFFQDAADEFVTDELTCRDIASSLDKLKDSVCVLLEHIIRAERYVGPATRDATRCFAEVGARQLDLETSEAAHRAGKPEKGAPFMKIKRDAEGVEHVVQFDQEGDIVYPISKERIAEMRTYLLGLRTGKPFSYNEEEYSVDMQDTINTMTRTLVDIKWVNARVAAIAANKRMSVVNELEEKFKDALKRVLTTITTHSKVELEGRMRAAGDDQATIEASLRNRAEIGDLEKVKCFRTEFRKRLLELRTQARRDANSMHAAAATKERQEHKARNKNPIAFRKQRHDRLTKSAAQAQEAKADAEEIEAELSTVAAEDAMDVTEPGAAAELDAPSELEEPLPQAPKKRVRAKPVKAKPVKAKPAKPAPAPIEHEPEHVMTTPIEFNDSDSDF